MDVDPGNRGNNVSSSVLAMDRVSDSSSSTGKKIETCIDIIPWAPVNCCINSSVPCLAEVADAYYFSQNSFMEFQYTIGDEISNPSFVIFNFGVA